MDLNPGRNIIIVNMKTRLYVPASPDEKWDGNWPSRYPVWRPYHAGEISAVNLWAHDVVNGIPFTYDLSRDGGHFTLWVYIDDHPDEAVDQAKRQLRRDHDVLTMRTIRITRFK
jgi:hypothetical protein